MWNIEWKMKKFLLHIQTKCGDIVNEILNVAIDAERTFKWKWPKGANLRLDVPFQAFVSLAFSLFETSQWHQINNYNRDTLRQKEPIDDVTCVMIFLINSAIEKTRSSVNLFCQGQHVTLYSVSIGCLMF